jgi:hypothetical protein
MENYQKLKEVIWKANPSILELKFGCEVQYGQAVFTFDGYRYEDRFSHLDPKEEFISVVESPDDYLLSDCKILGRPIQLADVLVAINKRWIKSGYVVMPEIEMGFLSARPTEVWFMLNDKRVPWNLKDDNLDHQSEETKTFLINLLI